MHNGQSNVMAMRRPGRRRSQKPDDNQPDCFIALPSDIPARDRKDLMERPFFSLFKNKRTAPIEYRVGENYIRVTANEKWLSGILRGEKLLYYQLLMSTD